MTPIMKVFWQHAYYVGHPFLLLYRHFFPIKDSARVLLIHENEVMLVRNIGGRKWSLPGGALNAGEDPAVCALRELKEELAIVDAEIEYKLGTYIHPTFGAESYVHVYVAKASSFYHKKQWEIDRAGWFTLNKLPPRLSPATARRMGEYKNGEKELENEIW